jgi:hypothetical protein
MDKTHKREFLARTTGGKKLSRGVWGITIEAQTFNISHKKTYLMSRFFLSIKKSIGYFVYFLGVA